METWKQLVKDLCSFLLKVKGAINHWSRTLTSVFSKYTESVYYRFYRRPSITNSNWNPSTSAWVLENNHSTRKLPFYITATVHTHYPLSIVDSHCYYAYSTHHSGRIKLYLFLLKSGWSLGRKLLRFLKPQNLTPIMRGVSYSNLHYWAENMCKLHDGILYNGKIWWVLYLANEPFERNWRV